MVGCAVPPQGPCMEGEEAVPKVGIRLYTSVTAFQAPQAVGGALEVR